MYLFIEALLVGRGGQNVTPLLSVQAGGRGQQGRPETHTFCDVTLCDIYVLKMFRSVTFTHCDRELNTHRELNTNSNIIHP
jgi:hypothetical protein